MCVLQETQEAQFYASLRQLNIKLYSSQIQNQPVPGLVKVWSKEF